MDEHFKSPHCSMHVTCMSYNMHIACMENIINPCMLHETCVLHACRYKWNLHVICAKVSACHYLNYACNMHVTCTIFRIGYSCVHEQKAQGRCIVGTVDKHGYGGQQKGTICDARGPCPSIWNTLKPDFHRIWLIPCAHESHRRLYLEIWRILC